MVKVAIADDHKLFREGMRFLIDQMDNLEVVFEASNGKELLDEIDRNDADILLLDLDMPEMDGLEVLKELRPQKPELGIIILTMHSDSKMIAYLMELGANSYLLKDTSPEEFEQAISSVMEEGFYFNQMVSKAMLGGLKGQAKKKPTLNHHESLTSREVEVLELICQEFTAKEIADKLFISHRTVEGHRKNLIEKLGVKNTAGLIVKAIKEGLISV
ncbi:response regulator [Roseivirga sp.]|uniref:response regulator transcription factor n=1 Tax=Roseivirga sp. TaxID=1964215 RepID=UPI003B52C92F